MTIYFFIYLSRNIFIVILSTNESDLFAIIIVVLFIFLNTIDCVFLVIIFSKKYLKIIFKFTNCINLILFFQMYHIFE